MCLRVRCFDPHVTRVRQILDSAGATDTARKEVA
jgi:hypothetical protein